MLDPKKIAEIDQLATGFNEIIPTLLFNFYRRLKDEGFPESFAFTLTCSLFDQLFASVIGLDDGPEGESDG